MTSAPFVSIGLRHTLAAAWRFQDAFTGRPVAGPIDVRVESIAPPYPRMPRVPWRAVAGEQSVYRFLVTNNEVAPIGTCAVSVTPPDEYAAYEPLTMTLPIVPAGPYPQASDFLKLATLWPTRSFKPPAGETVVVGSIVSSGALASVAGLRITLWSAVHATPPLGTPYTYTDAKGDFVFRLLGPDFRVSVSGGVVTTTANVAIDVRAPPTFAAAVVPTTAFPQTVQLGRMTTLPILVP